MPNHVTNIIETTPAVVAAITRHHTEDEKRSLLADNARKAARYIERTGRPWPYAEEEARKVEARFVDFNMVLPMPHHDDPIFTAERTEYGGGSVGYGMDGYSPLEWARENWSTKWNGYETEVEHLAGDLCRVKFETAWSHPEPVARALSALFPDEVLEVSWADEDHGYNVGRYSIADGDKVSEVTPEGGSVAALEMASQIRCGMTYAEYRAEWEES